MSIVSKVSKIDAFEQKVVNVTIQIITINYRFNLNSEKYPIMKLGGETANNKFT